MKRYCAEGFRDLTKDSFLGDDKEEDSEYTWKAYDYLEKCEKENNSQKLVRKDDEGWSEYGISNEERDTYFLRLLHPQKGYLIDVPANRMDTITDKEKYLIDFMNRNTKMCLCNMAITINAYWDILDEMCLALFRISSNTVELSEHAFFMDSEKKEAARNYFRNQNRGKSVRLTPFAMPELRLSAEIDSFGADIVYSWIFSTQFRRLFQEVTTDSRKYELAEYIRCIDDLKNLIGNKIENKLILNKLVCGNFIKFFYKHIYPYIKDIRELSYLKNFVEIVMDLDGNNIRCAVLEFLERELYNIKDFDEKYKLRRICLYSSYLKEIVPTVNKQYKELRSIWLSDFQKNYSFIRWIKWLVLEIEAREFNVDYGRHEIDYSSLINDFGKIENSEIMKTIIRAVITKNIERYCDQ